MSKDPSSEAGVPEEVSSWLADVADERGLSREELLERIVSADGADGPVAASRDVAELAERVDDLEAAVSDLDDAVDDQIRDVRDRVIQVKREADGKAPVEHDHPEIAERLQQVAEHLEALGNDFVDLDASLDRVEETVEDLDDRTTRGFSNYEDVLEYLVDATDDLNAKVEAIARTVLELRAATGRLDADTSTREAVDRLREAAQEHGVTAAKCEECGESIQLGLLTAPSCPNCESAFARLDPNRGFFRSSVLRTGHRPALEGAVDPDAPDLEAIVETDVDSAPEVDPVASPADDDPGTVPGDPTAGAESTSPASGGGADVLDVEEVSGIGSAYAERLRDAGVETVGQLARAEPETLAGETEVPPARVDKWVSRAREMDESE